MKYTIAGAALVAALSTPALADEPWQTSGVRSRDFSVDVIATESNASLGKLWHEKKEPNFPKHEYGDAAYDIMFRKGDINARTLSLDDIYNPNGSSVSISCPRGTISCPGSGILNVAGGEWEAGNHLVDAIFRYEMEYVKGFFLENYDKETGVAELVYRGPKAPYQFYACGEAPATADNEPSGDLLIKFASEETPSECQDVRLEVNIGAGREDGDWEHHSDPDCQFSGC